jgi:hypothetical protein
MGSIHEISKGKKSLATVPLSYTGKTEKAKLKRWKRNDAKRKKVEAKTCEILFLFFCEKKRKLIETNSVLLRDAK